nr:autophagy-related protein 9A-like [Dromaius novaehollandiae]
MMLSDLFELVQFLFVVTFTTFLLCCVEYDVLFANRPLNRSRAGTPDRGKVILPAPQCARSIRASGWIIFLLAMAAVFWLYRLVKVLCGLLSYWEIRTFYVKALRIPSDGLCNYSWQEVQARLISLQREQQMCVHKKELTELDIYHRILRFKNYTVAMVNKSLLPVRFQLPLLGPVVFLTQGLKYNLELLLFWGPGSLFQNKWNLQPQYKRAGPRLELAQRLARTMVLLGLANLLLCPLVLVWQVLYAFFSYAEVIKREPGSLGARRWSLYGRHYLRHFNELNHELQARLSRGYKPATKYMNSFASPLLAVLAKNVAFFAGSILAVLIVLTVYDEDVLTVQHILTAGVCGAMGCPWGHGASVGHLQGICGAVGCPCGVCGAMGHLWGVRGASAGPCTLPALGVAPGCRAGGGGTDTGVGGCTAVPRPRPRTRPRPRPRPRARPHGASARSLLLSESRLLSLSRSALLAEVASAEMSLHAIYMHELHQQQQQQQQQQGAGPHAAAVWVAAGAPKPPAVTTGSAARASQAQQREMPLGGWAEEDEDEDEDEEEPTG